MSNFEVLAVLGYVIACIGCAITLSLLVYSYEQDKKIKELEKVKEKFERMDERKKEYQEILSVVMKEIEK